MLQHFAAFRRNSPHQKKPTGLFVISHLPQCNACKAGELAPMHLCRLPGFTGPCPSTTLDKFFIYFCCILQGKFTSVNRETIKFLFFSKTPIKQGNLIKNSGLFPLPDIRQKHPPPFRYEPLQTPSRIGRTGGRHLHRSDTQLLLLIPSIKPIRRATVAKYGNRPRYGKNPLQIRRLHITDTAVAAADNLTAMNDIMQSDMIA